MVANFELDSLGIISDFDHEYDEITDNSEKDGDGCLKILLSFTALAIILACFSLWTLILMLPLTVLLWLGYAILSSSSETKKYNTLFIKRKFNYELEHDYRVFRTRGHDYEDIIVLLSPEDTEILRSKGKNIPDSFMKNDTDGHRIGMVLHDGEIEPIDLYLDLDEQSFKNLPKGEDNCILFLNKHFESTNTCGIVTRVFVDYKKCYARYNSVGF